MAKQLRIVLIALLVSALVLAAAACGQPATPTTAPEPTIESVEAPTAKPAEPTPAPAPEPVELTVWAYLADVELEAFEEVVQSWESETGNKVTLVNYPYFELLNKVEIAFPAGEGPDLCEIPHSNTGLWGEAGLIVPFPDDIYSQERSQYQESAIAAFMLEGKLYAIPQIADLVALLYNKALIPEVPETMEGVIEAAKELTKDDTYGLLLLDNNMWFGWPFIGGYGGYIFGQSQAGFDPEDVGLASAGAIEGMEYLLKLRNEHQLIPPDLDWNVLTGKFTEGQCAMIVMNANQAPVYRNAGIDVGIAVLPELPNGKMPAPLLNLHGWAINGFSQKQQAAAELAAYLGAKLPVPLYKAASGNIPVRLDVLQDPAIAGDPDAVAMAQQVGFAQAIPNIPEMAEVWVPTDSAFQLAAKGDMTPAQALQEAAQATIQAIEAAE